MLSNIVQPILYHRVSTTEKRAMPLFRTLLGTPCLRTLIRELHINLSIEIIELTVADLKNALSFIRGQNLAAAVLWERMFDEVSSLDMPDDTILSLDVMNQTSWSKISTAVSATFVLLVPNIEILSLDGDFWCWPDFNTNSLPRLRSLTVDNRNDYVGNADGLLPACPNLKCFTGVGLYSLDTDQPLTHAACQEINLYSSRILPVSLMNAFDFFIGLTKFSHRSFFPISLLSATLRDISRALLVRRDTLRDVFIRVPRRVLENPSPMLSLKEMSKLDSLSIGAHNITSEPDGDTLTQFLPSGIKELTLFIDSIEIGTAMVPALAALGHTRHNFAALETVNLIGSVPNTVMESLTPVFIDAGVTLALSRE